MGQRTPRCGTSDLNWRIVDEWFLNGVYVMRPLMYLSMVCGMLVCENVYVNVCMFAVSNALLMSNDSACGWNGLVETFCDSVVDIVECLVLNPCCVVMFGMFCVMYGRITLSSVVAITDRRDIGLYDVPILRSLLGLGIGMMLANFHT